MLFFRHLERGSKRVTLLRVYDGERQDSSSFLLRFELLQVVLLELVRDEDPSLVEERQRDDGLGTRFSNTPMSRGQRPDSDALIGLFLKTALASAWAAFGLTVLPSRSLAYAMKVATAR